MITLGVFEPVPRLRSSTGRAAMRRSWRRMMRGARSWLWRGGAWCRLWEWWYRPVDDVTLRVLYDKGFVGIGGILCQAQTLREAIMLSLCDAAAACECWRRKNVTMLLNNMRTCTWHQNQNHHQPTPSWWWWCGCDHDHIVKMWIIVNNGSGIDLFTTYSITKSETEPAFAAFLFRFSSTLQRPACKVGPIMFIYKRIK